MRQTRIPDRLRQAQVQVDAVDEDLQRRKALPRRLQETLVTTFVGVASVIRASRNDAGHPALPHVERDDAFILLRLFPTYRHWVYAGFASCPCSRLGRLDLGAAAS